MKNKAVVKVMLTLLLMSMLSLASDIQLVKSEPRTWTVDDDGPADFSSIQEAINDANDGDTIYVYDGTYYENVVVSKSVSLVGEDSSNTIIDGRGVGNVVKITADSVTVTEFQMRNSGLLYSGIWIDGGDNNTISNNWVTQNGRGIVLMPYSSYNIVSNNNITGNELGTYLSRSPHNTFSGNDMSENNRNFGISGGTSLTNYVQEIDPSNTVDDRPIYYLINENNLVVDPFTFPNAGYLALVNCNNITVKNLTLTKNEQGLLLVHTDDSIVENVNVLDNNRGIVLLNSNNNIINKINMTESDQVSLWVTYSDSNIIHHNYVKSGHNGGMWITDSDHNEVSCNNITYNNYGISVHRSSYNTINNNSIRNNDNYGISFYESSYNTINNNSIRNNEYGLNFDKSNNNTLCDNTFVNNTHQVHINQSFNNAWDTAILPDVYNQLLSEYDTLSSDYESLQDDHESLQGLYAFIEDLYFDLEARYETLTNELTNMRNFVYALIITTIAFMATTIYFATRRHKMRPDSQMVRY